MQIKWKNPYTVLILNRYVRTASIVERNAGSREMFIVIGIITPQEVDTCDAMSIYESRDYYVLSECTSVHNIQQVERTPSLFLVSYPDGSGSIAFSRLISGSTRTET